jgi:SAM-dependent methyltransferase
VTTTIDASTDRASGPFERLANSVCRRAFSSPEALAYELTIARSLSAVVVPAIIPYVVGRRVLDVGCGGGRIAAGLVAELPVSVVGVDPSASQIKRLARQTQRTAAVTGARALGQALPFADSSFDTVVSSCAWKHWSEPRRGIAECLRVLRPGGSLVIVEIDGSSTATEFWRFARSSRIPLGMRRAYLRFAMRTVVGVAPDKAALERSFLAAGAEPPEIRHVEAMPFWLATLGGFDGSRPDPRTVADSANEQGAAPAGTSVPR